MDEGSTIRLLHVANGSATTRLIVEAGILPEGALQLLIGATGDLLDRLGPQDVMAFTG